MSEKRHVIRKARPQRHRSVDDQLWPLVIAMCVLGAFLAGTILAYLRLDDPRWYANAWTYLIAIPLVITSLFVALAVTGNRWLRRTMQLALILGVLFHLGLLIVAIETDVFHRVWTEVLTSTDRSVKRELVKAPHYTRSHHDPQRRLQRSLSAPVETGEAEASEQAVPRESLRERTADMATRSVPLPRPEPSVQPDVMRREQVNQTIPRQRDQRSRISRRTARLPARPIQAVDVPRTVPRTERRPVTPQPSGAGTPKVNQPVTSSRPSPAAPAPMPRPRPQPRSARTVPERAAPPQPSSLARLPRRERAAEVAPRSDVPVGDKPAIARQRDAEAVEPHNLAARKQQSEAPTQRDSLELPVRPTTRQSAPRRREPRQPAPSREALAQTPQPADLRRRRVTRRPDLTSQADSLTRVIDDPLAAPQGLAPRPLAAQRADRDGPQPSKSAADLPAARPPAPEQSSGGARRSVAAAEPAAGSVSAIQAGRSPARATPLGARPQQISPEAREATAQNPSEPAPPALAATRTDVSRAAAGSTATQRRFPSVDTVGGARAPQRAQRQLARRATPAQPSLSRQADVQGQRRRVRRPAPELASPRAAENPIAGTPRATPAAADPAPSTLALNKATAGIAGRGAGANLEAADPSADSPAKVASGAARRAEAAQHKPEGPALQPQAPALVRDGRAGRRQPTAVLQATPLTPAVRPGTQRPSEVAASASAALTESAADADRGDVTAAKGTLEVDLGPTTRVTQSGAGRASGGGGPERASGREWAQLPRSEQGRTPVASLLAEATERAAAAPRSEAGSQPSDVALDDNPNAVVEARPEPQDAALGGRPAPGGGELATPTRSLAPAVRRAARGADGPSLAELADRSPRMGRRSRRDRQPPSETSVADLSAGNAANRDDRETPATALAAADVAGSLDRQPTSEESPADAARANAGMPAGPPGEVQASLAARAEAVDAAEGPAVPGGGSDAAARRALNAELAVDLRADVPRVAGAADSSGRPEADPQSTQGRLITRLAQGIDARRSETPVGGRPTQVAVDGRAGDHAGRGLARRARSDSSLAGPAVQADDQASPLAKRTAESLDVSPRANTVQGMPVGDPLLDAPDDRPGPSALPQVGPRNRMADAALPVAVDAPEGIGGLDRQPSVEVGVSDRRASISSDQVQLNSARFERRQWGGAPDLDTAAAVAAEPFRRRARRQQASGDPALGAGPETEEAVELGLAYLRRVQTPDGRWTLDCAAAHDGLPQMASDTAATGLALLAFQGAGYHHMEYRYAEIVRAGIDFLVTSQTEDGDLYLPMDDQSNRVVALYSHSIAALALCEAYGMTQDPKLRDPAQRALDFIVASQHPDRGGWRYAPGVGSDTSVTGWMMMALKSGQLANLRVPDDTYARIEQWLDRAQADPSQPHLYCYNPYAPNTPEQRGGRRPSRSMTSVGLLMRLYSGWRRDNPHMGRGAQYLLEAPPAVGTRTNPQRDTYYWYYATQVMFHMGGRYWKSWNQRLHPLLVTSQIREGELAGSWDPRRPVADRWAPFAGRLYVTTMNLLSLEVTYRYLPLYEDTAR